MLSARDVEAYRRQGFLVIPDVVSPAEIAELRRVTDEFLARSRAVTGHTEMFDLEDGHSPASPRLRRLISPHRWHPVYEAMVRHPRIVEVLKALWGPNVRFDQSKLNMKSAGYGSPIEWHQDWAFYPHTNDDLAAVGIMIDDVDEDNGPMLLVPGSHTGPVYDHHANGRFCGAIDAAATGLDVAGAVPCLGKAGTITVHHVRMVHGSATNRSNRQRRFLLHQYRAADAWPLTRAPQDFAAWTSLLVSGEETLAPRLAPVPVRLPLPPATNQGSIYENQRELGSRYFAGSDAAASAAPARTSV
ncbi:MAG: phytanoyl-CoA dioxygenase family protein [Alphaproteobacteria bacterium]|nr:phytanoyl-CoA dioxygenase family protein [Alphaproteobacteria bacterium]